MFKNIVTRYGTCKYFKLQRAAVKQLGFLNEKNRKGH